MLTPGDIPVLIDFGQALLIPPDPYHPGDLCRLPLSLSRFGKEYYCPLEVVIDGAVHEDRRPFDAILADMWQLGVLLCIMFSGQPPFATFNDSSSEESYAYNKHRFYALVSRGSANQNINSQEYLTLFQTVFRFQHRMISASGYGHVFKLMIQTVCHRERRSNISQLLEYMRTYIQDNSTTVTPR